MKSHVLKTPTSSQAPVATIAHKMRFETESSTLIT